jgi:hypothetical protein
MSADDSHNPDFIDGKGRSVLPYMSVVPILSSRPDGAHILGTGFFVSNIGHIVTAKHVLFARDGKSLEPGLFVPFFFELTGKQALTNYRKFTKITYSNNADLAIASLEFPMKTDGIPRTNKLFTLDFEPPAVGSTVTVWAYPWSSPVFMRPGQSANYIVGGLSGEVVRYSETPRDSVMVSWPYIEMTIAGGAYTSGGPVFNSKGHVIGVYSCDGAGSSYACRALDLITLKVPHWPGVSCNPQVAELIMQGDMRAHQTIKKVGSDYQIFKKAKGD